MIEFDQLEQLGARQCLDLLTYPRHCSKRDRPRSGFSYKALAAVDADHGGQGRNGAAVLKVAVIAAVCAIVGIVIHQ